MPFDKLRAVMSRADVEKAHAEGRVTVVEFNQSMMQSGGFYLHDPEPQPQPPQPVAAPDEKQEQFDAMKDTLRAGVKVVTAPQLFPTPPDLARRMANLAGSTLAGKRVLEPSAGTGNLVRAAMDAALGFDSGLRVVAVEINPGLVAILQQRRQKTLYATEDNYTIREADFLECNGDLGVFDCVLMNPPFQDAADIRHIKHALTMLKPGGRLVALCANGPRQNEALRPIASTWEELPADTFKEAGTSVHAVLLTIDA